MIKKLLVSLVVITMLLGAGVGIASEEQQDQSEQSINTIPNFTTDTVSTDTNGRAAHLDTEKEADQLNPVERTIIIQDAIRSNQLRSN